MTDLIPIVSFLFLAGKCRRCHKKLSWFYPIVETLTGIAFVLTWIYAPATILLVKVAYLGLIASLIVIFFADLKYQIIPDQMQLATVFFISVIIGFARPVGMHVLSNIAAGVASLGIILALFLITRGRGMGFGDVKLAFSAGLLLGFKGGFFSLYIAFVVGALYGVILLMTGKKKLKSKIAFGPFIVLGIVTVIFARPVLDALLYSIYGI